MHTRSTGFTLIEILVVMAIIALLAAIIFASLASANQKSLDVHRKEDLRNIQKALELYYTDNQSYPNSNGYTLGNSPMGGNTANWIPGLTPKYMPALPQDPNYSPSACGGWEGAYLYTGNAQSYKLIDHCPQNSAVGSTPSSDAFYDPTRPTWAWMLCYGSLCSA